MKLSDEDRAKAANIAMQLIDELSLQGRAQGFPPYVAIAGMISASITIQVMVSTPTISTSEAIRRLEGLLESLKPRAGLLDDMIPRGEE